MAPTVLAVAYSVLALLTYGRASAIAKDSNLYNCILCVSAVENAITTKEPSLEKSCQAMFSPEICRDYTIFSNGDIDLTSIIKSGLPTEPRAMCEKHAFCSNLESESWVKHNKDLKNRNEDVALDIRVAKAYGSKGYDKVRLSVISDRSIESEFFSYSQQFKYRWTTNYLNTGIVSVTPGSYTTFSIVGQNVSIYIPAEGAPVRGVMMGDPCFSNEYVWCTYGDDFDTYNRSTTLLNAINAPLHSSGGQGDDGAADFWMLLGDNFYDLGGDVTAAWFAALSPETKAKVYGSVPGNHDFWIMSSPVVALQNDQLGNGFMQWNAQDVAASIGDGSQDNLVPFDFSQDPDAEGANGHTIPIAKDFFWYYKLGNLGIIGYSGGHTFQEMAPDLEEACAYMTTSGAAAVALVGHWNMGGLGCPPNSSVPSTFHHMLGEQAEAMNVPSCKTLAPKMRYFEGHKHCNKIVETDIGFMVGGQGMTATAPCDGNYGLPVVDTYNGTFSVYFFDIGQAGSSDPADNYDNYDAILDCITNNGVQNCYHLATVWTDVPL